jgi:2-oxoglutarate ferredoxin oxidoreductase subunit alpha
VNVEGNYSAQMHGLIAEKTGVNIEKNILRYDGRPFFVEELVREIKKFI